MGSPDTITPDPAFDDVMAQLRADEPLAVAPAKKPAKPKAKKKKPKYITNKPNYRVRDDYLRGVLKLTPDTPLPNGDILKVRDSLGLPKERWDNLKMRAINELGGLSMIKIVPRILMIYDFDSVEQIRRAIEVGKEMMNRPKDEIEDGDRIAAGAMMAKCAEALTNLSEQIVELCEKGLDKSAMEAAQAQAPKPKNLPPQVAVQVNLAPGQADAKVGVVTTSPDATPTGLPSATSGTTPT